MDIRIEGFHHEETYSLGDELNEDDQRCWIFVSYQKNSKGLDELVSVLRIVSPRHVPDPNAYEDPDEEPYVKLGSGNIEVYKA